MVSKPTASNLVFSKLVAYTTTILPIQVYINGLVQDYNNSIADGALDLLQSCTKPSTSASKITEAHHGISET